MYIYLPNIWGINSKTYLPWYEASPDDFMLVGKVLFTRAQCNLNEEKPLRFVGPVVPCTYQTMGTHPHGYFTLLFFQFMWWDWYAKHQKKCIWTFGSKSLNAHDYVTTLNENVWTALNGAFPIIYDLRHSLTRYAKVFECKVKSLNTSDYIITFNGIVWMALNGAFPLYMICGIFQQFPTSIMWHVMMCL